MDNRLLAFWREWRGFLLFLFLMCAFRSSFADIYYVPSGSMQPTVLEGDRLFTDKMAYDLRLPFTGVVLWHRAEPVRGDIVTLYSPEDGKRLVKRVVGVPGDVITMHGDVLNLDGRPLPYLAPGAGEGAALPDAQAYIFGREDLAGRVHQVMFIPGRLALRDFGPVTVPVGEYFVMGDNRDDSKDSRYIGFIRERAITGRVLGVAYSLDPARHYLPRLTRSFDGLH